MGKYKVMLEELNLIVDQLQDDSADIDVALEKYQQAKKLVKKIEEYLQTSENKIETINLKLSE